MRGGGWEVPLPVVGVAGEGILGLYRCGEGEGKDEEGSVYWGRGGIF